MSSTVSCSSAAHSVSVSRRMPAQIFATPTGWTMKSSPDWRRWSAWCSQANTNASTTRVAVDRLGDLVGVLRDDREQVGEQLALERRQVVRDRRRRRRRRARRGRPGGAPATATGRRAVRPRRRRSTAAVGVRVVASGRRSARCAAASGMSVRPRAVAGRPGRPPSARARCAPGASADREGRPVAIEVDEAELGEDPHQPARERRGPRLRPVARGAPPRRPPRRRRPPRAARGRGRPAGRAGRSPIVYRAAKPSSGSPHARWVQPLAGQMFEQPACACGRVDGDDVREAARPARDRPRGRAHEREREAADPVAAAPRARCGAWAATASTRLAGGDEVGEQPGDAAAAHVARRLAALARPPAPAPASDRGRRASRGAGRAPSSARDRLREACRARRSRSIAAGADAARRGAGRAAARPRRSSG